MDKGNIQIKDLNKEEEDCFYKNNRELFYSFDFENKCFKRHVSYQNESNQLIIQQGWDIIEERLMEIINKIRRNGSYFKTRH